MPGPQQFPRQPVPPVERFWSHVQTDEGCWVWTGGLDRGYGVFSPASGFTERAHRLSFAMAYGRIPDGLSVLHVCDNPPCVRPSHLFLGTLQDNIADAVSKGRMNYGARNAWATAPAIMAARKPPLRVSDERVAEIRAAFAAGESMTKIARRLALTASGVSRIVNGQRHAA